MSNFGIGDIFYQIGWLKFTGKLLLSFISNKSTKTKRSLPEEAECGTIAGIKLWLSEGADINATDVYGYTPLMNAAMLGRLDVVKLLIENGVDIQKQGQFSYTALHAAAQGGHLDVVQCLVQYGASVNCRNSDGDIPLILAVRGNHAEIIDYLLKYGSDIHQNGCLGQSAVQTAIANGDQATADTLLSREMLNIRSPNESRSRLQNFQRENSSLNFY